MYFKFTFYYENGIVSNELLKDKFYIIKDDDSHNYQYLLSDIERKINILSTRLLKLLNCDNELFRLLLYCVPYSGISPESALNKDEFSKIILCSTNMISGKSNFINDNNKLLNSFYEQLNNLPKDLTNNIFRYYYCFDLLNMLDTLAEFIFNIEQYFIDFYISLCNVPYNENNENNENVSSKVFFTTGREARACYCYLNSFIITFNSVFDIMTKFIMEIQSFKKDNFDFKSYKEFSCNNILFKNKNIRKINCIDIKDTIFELDENIKLILCFRDDIIHNQSISPFSHV